MICAKCGQTVSILSSMTFLCWSSGAFYAVHGDVYVLTNSSIFAEHVFYRLNLGEQSCLGPHAASCMVNAVLMQGIIQAMELQAEAERRKRECLTLV